jgi:hypothetical protein
MNILPSTTAGKLRFSVLLVALICTAYFSKIQVLYYYLSYSPQEGDIIFQSLPHGELVDAIEGVTHSPFSHCGVVIRDGNKWVVIESISNVHTTPLLRWMQRGRGAGFAVYRLDCKYQNKISDFKRNLKSYLGLPYNYEFTMSDKEMYCSGLVYKAFLKTTGEQMGSLQKLGDLDWKPFEDFIKSDQGNELPLDRVMITPDSLSHAKQVHEILKEGIYTNNYEY